MKRITLRDARRRAKLTQVQLAERSGVEQTVISKLEVGKIANPSFTTVVDLAAALGLDPRCLRFGVIRDHRSDEKVVA